MCRVRINSAHADEDKWDSEHQAHSEVNAPNPKHYPHKVHAE